MAEKKVYVLDDGANQYEAMTREQIIAAITQAVNEGTISDIDAGFITKIQEMNKKGILKWWVGTQAEFNALETKDSNTLYLFTDDPLYQDFINAITSVENKIQAEATTREEQDNSLATKIDSVEQNLNKVINGETEVKKANETKIANIINTDSLTGSTSWVTTESSANPATITIPLSLIPNDGSYVYAKIDYDLTLTIEYDDQNGVSTPNLSIPIVISRYRGVNSVQFSNDQSLEKILVCTCFCEFTTYLYPVFQFFRLIIQDVKESGSNLTFKLQPVNRCTKIVTPYEVADAFVRTSTLYQPRVTLYKQIGE